MERINNVQVVRAELTTVQAGRAVAALLVVLYHASIGIFALDRYWGSDPLRGLFQFGHAGVDFFFVLSGFIIFYVHQRDIGRPDQIANYVRKRLVRIYPVYWIVLAAIIPIYFFFPQFGTGFEQDPLAIASSILLVHLQDGWPILPVAWTLCHEVLFYALFAVAICNRKLGFALMVAWMSVSALMPFTAVRETLLGFWFAGWHLQFAMGMIACIAVRHNRISSPWATAIMGVLVFSLVATDENGKMDLLSDGVRHIVYGIGSALAITGAVTLENRQLLRAPKAIRLIGDASYAIYLTHTLVLSILAKLSVAAARSQVPDLLMYAILVSLAVSIGVTFHLWVERPLLKFIRFCGTRSLSRNLPKHPFGTRDLEGFVETSGGTCNVRCAGTH